MSSITGGADKQKIQQQKTRKQKQQQQQTVINNIHLNNPRISLAQNSLRHHGPDILISLQDDINMIKESTILNSFKKRIKDLLLNQYTSITNQS